MTDIKLSWKSFKIHLPDMEIWMRQNCGEHYVGNSANSSFMLHFSEEPGDQIRARVQQYWDSLTESVEKAKLDHDDAIDRALKAARDAIPMLDWNTMVPAQRKMVMGQTLSAQDREDVLAKYPNS